MKTKIDAIIVVEGKMDVAFLQSFIDAEFVITNGSEIPSSTISYLKEASNKKDIIVLTDPDYPGLRIRNLINSAIPTSINAFVRKEVSIKHNKVGVAESTKKEVLFALNNIQINKSGIKGNLTNTDLFNLGLTGKNNSKDLRIKVSEHFHLGFTNSKTLLKRLNEMNISYENISRYLYGKE